MTALQLCWLRNDLRVHDNPALQGALAAGPTVAVYIATPRQWERHEDAPVKIDFWRRNLVALAPALERLGVALRCFQVDDYAAVPALLEEVLRRWDVGALHYNREYPLNEMRRDREVERRCRARGVAVLARDDQVLLAPGRVRTGAGEPYKVFTPFARAARRLLEGAAFTHQAPPAPQPRKTPGGLPAPRWQRALNDLDWPAAAAAWRERWPAGEQAAGRRLRRFSEAAIGDYPRQRDLPAVDGTSCLSPYLGSGVISVRECWRQAATFQAGEGVESWRQELLWRDFYRHVMYHYPHVCRGEAWRDPGPVPWRDSEQDLARWREGRTGFPLVDAAMRQLAATGWMHNRLRMLCAMFLSKHLLLDWRRGESWFMRHLVDGDFASNNGGWQWSASTGTDAVPYFRVFNPVTQSQRFDPAGEFIRRYVPELGKLNAKAIHLPGKEDRPANYPAPMIDHKYARQRALEAFAKK